ATAAGAFTLDPPPFPTATRHPSGPPSSGRPSSRPRRSPPLLPRPLAPLAARLAWLRCGPACPLRSWLVLPVQRPAIGAASLQGERSALGFRERLGGVVIPAQPLQVVPALVVRIVIPVIHVYSRLNPAQLLAHQAQRLLGQDLRPDRS